MCDNPTMSAEWDDLRFLLAVHREKTVLGAAHELDVDRATVFRRLAALEARLGARLFDRTRAGCTLTRAGQSILPAAVEMEQASASVATRVAGEDARVRGVVRVAMTEGFASSFFVPKLAP